MERTFDRSFDRSFKTSRNEKKRILSLREGQSMSCDHTDARSLFVRRGFVDCVFEKSRKGLAALLGIRREKCWAHSRFE